MITSDDRLIVFEQFVIDPDLPKFKRPAPSPGRKASSSGEAIDLDDEESSDDGFVRGFGEGARVNWASVGNNGVGSIQLVPITGTVFNTPPKRRWWQRKPKPAQPFAEPVPALSIEGFFTSVKNTTQELQVIEARAAGYERAMKDARTAGQKALLERLEAGLNAYRMETQLVAMGLTRYVAEEAIVGFYKQCKKGLRLDWVQNFVRVIPPQVIEKKRRADELGIFDNYAVLHYDPQAKSYAETEAEKAAKRDPILFGLMRGRRVLYVVGDWIDDVCDLTLDQLAEALGKGAIGSLDGASGDPYRTA